MNELPARSFLQGLRRLTRQVTLYPADHPLTGEALEGFVGAAGAFVTDHPERVLAVAGDSFYMDRVLLPHTSLEHNGLLRELQSRTVQSVTVRNPVSSGDLFDLAAFVAGVSDDLPAEGTIRLNEEPYTDTPWGAGALAELRRSYTGGLDAVRRASYAVAAEGACDLAAVMQAVQGFLAPSMEHASATLLLSTVKSHDEYTFYHSLNTCILAISLGRLFGLSDLQLLMIGAGAALHDIGKTAVSPAVLNHPGRLSREQWQEMKIHPQEGAQAIMAAGGPGHETAATIALEHHVRFDGSGYPHRRGSPRPHSFSQLVTVADIYDSVTTRRPYRRAYTPGQALGVLVDGAGTMFDPDMVDAFIHMMGVYPPGSVVRLAGGEIAIVSRPDPDDLSALHAIIAKAADGRPIPPEPSRIRTEQILEPLLPSEAGVDPISVMQQAEMEDHVLG